MIDFFSKKFFIWLGHVSLAMCAGLICLYLYLNMDMPKINTLKDYSPPIITSVFSDDGRKIGEFYKERRIVIPLSQMPRNLINAFCAAEDSRFRQHPGIDIFSILRAFIKNFKAGSIVQGGSTITQQVTKSFLLTSERTYERKIKEAILAYRIEKKLTKDEILYLYLNQIYLGHGAYGVEAASENYFGKHARDLNLAECAMLAGLPQAPSKYSPLRFPDRAKQRQIYVLGRMNEDGLINNLELRDATDLKLEIKHRKTNWFMERVPYYTEYVRRYVEKKYGSEFLYEQGLQIHTAVSIELQKIGRYAVNKGLIDLDRRIGYRGPVESIPLDRIESFCRNQISEEGIRSLEKGVVYKGVVLDTENNISIVRVGDFKGIIRLETMKWARKPDTQVAYYEAVIKSPSEVFKPGDVILVRVLKEEGKDGELEFTLEQEAAVQAALLSIEAETGHVKAMIGGKDYKESQFNRAYQSRRQIGSAFKPIIYAAALDKGYTPASVIIDSPVTYEYADDAFIWKPHNYREKFYGPTLFRKALVKSFNVVTVKILKDIGIDYVVDYTKKLGITSRINRDLSIALGSSGISLLEAVKAYSVFSNLGYLMEPVFITEIYDRNGDLLESSKLTRKKVIGMDTAYIMTNLMESVIKSGTGWRVRALKRPVAGKTGTTNNLLDAWFLGYTPEYTTGVWVGFDQEASLGRGETGSRTASPIWLDFMKKALKGKPVRTFNVPEGVLFVKIDAKTGLLPTEHSKDTIFECFKEGTVPTEYTQESDKASDSEKFFKEEI